jgi:hypothetical protein
MVVPSLSDKMGNHAHASTRQVVRHQHRDLSLCLAALHLAPPVFVPFLKQLLNSQRTDGVNILNHDKDTPKS